MNCTERNPSTVFKRYKIQFAASLLSSFFEKLKKEKKNERLRDISDNFPFKSTLFENVSCKELFFVLFAAYLLWIEIINWMDK